ncbi:MAG: anthranilate phosphoribosyltransferase [Pseudomonadota bacterium]
MSQFKPFLEIAVSGTPLAAADMQAAMDVILGGDAGDVEIAGFLAALRARGETIEEIAAAAGALRGKASGVEAPPGAVDTAGTGGDGAETFNISTAAALIAAGAGAIIAKHGNRSVSSRSGSSDVLEALGVNLDADAATISRCMREAGIGFMFAPRHHQAVRYAAPARQGLGVRTLFNLIGPLANPAGAKRQLLGVYDAALVTPMAGALKRLGAEKAWVVHGSDGLDEITTTGRTRVAQLADGAITEFEIDPESVGVKPARLDELKGGDAQENADAIRALLDGAPGPFRDIAVMNAGATLVVAGNADDLKGGVKRAARAIDSGEARAALERLVAITNGGQ